MPNTATMAHRRHCFSMGLNARRKALRRNSRRTSRNETPLPIRYSRSDWYCCMSCVHCLRPRSQA